MIIYQKVWLSNDMKDDTKELNHMHEYNIRVCANCPFSGFIVDCEDVDCESVIKIWNELNELKESERFEQDKDV